MRHVVSDVADDAVIVCWATVAVVWIVGAVLARVRGPAVRRRKRLELASLTGFAVGAATVLTPGAWWRPLTLASLWPRAAGASLLIPATAVTIWSRLALGTMWSASVVVKEKHALRTSGPYRFIRHPIYAAIVAMVAATALDQGIGRWAVVLAGVTAAVLLKARAEERLLLQEFPDEYSRYQRRVPQLVPLPHRRRP